MTHRFHIVDVFADRPYTGNPLAVVLGADDLAAETMQQIAAEMNYSETTFVRSDPESDGGWHVRMFTPAHEIAFAGHPILGTAWVIQHYLAASAATSLLLRVGVGPVPVSFEPADDGTPAAWFVAPPISIGRTCHAEPIAAALGISPSDIDQTAPILELSAGISATLVPLRSRDALRRSRLDLAAFSPLARLGFARSCMSSAAKHATPVTK